GAATPPRSTRKRFRTVVTLPHPPVSLAYRSAYFFPLECVLYVIPPAAANTMVRLQFSRYHHGAGRGEERMHPIRRTARRASLAAALLAGALARADLAAADGALAVGEPADVAAEGYAYGF